MNNMEEENATQNGRKMTKKKTQNQMDRPNQKGYRNESKIGKNYQEA